MEFMLVLLVAAVIAIAAFAWGVGAYNRFVGHRNRIQESWRQVDVELNRRYELIPNLVETVRAFAAHERNTLAEITSLRTRAQGLARAEGGAAPSAERAQVEEQLSGAVSNLLVSVEAYPDLKSNVNFLELQRQLAETEDRIAAGRRFYNANVRDYNTRIESVPSNIIAGFAKFEKATYFEVNDPAVRQAPGVNFGEISQRPAASAEQPQIAQQQTQQPVQPPQQQIQAPRYDDVAQPYQPPQRAQEPPAQPAVPPPAQDPGQGDTGGYRPPFSN